VSKFLKEKKMKLKLIRSKKNLLIFTFAVLPLILFSQEYNTSLLQQNFDLAGIKEQKTQYYTMESQLIVYAPDGTIVGRDLFKLYLQWVPAAIAKKEGDEFTCTNFKINFGDSVEVEIPSLKNYTFTLKPGIDAKNQIFGLDHSKFANLSDHRGQPIPPDKSYHVFNAFVDFFSFCLVFAEPSGGGKDIGELKNIGQRIIHAAAFSEPPIHLGDGISEESFFKNGEITLTFKGLSLVKEKPCAIIGYDSGESSFKMIATPAPDMKIITVGSSHYQGDIYKDLQTNWVQKSTLHEIVVTEASMPPNTYNGIVERIILVQNVSEQEFEGAK
jgi:hypothetical protein